MKRSDAILVLEYQELGMRDPVVVQRIRGTQYSLIAGCQTLELTRAEAVHVAHAILKDAGEEAGRTPDRQSPQR